MESNGQARLTEAMTALLQRFRPLLEERVATVETAAKAALEDALSDDLRQQGRGAAHKLAGVMGTFGYQKGTELAREAETLLNEESATNSQMTARLGEIAVQLRGILAAIPRN